MTTPTVHTRPWGSAPDGQPITQFTLTLPGGVQARLTDLGATLTSLHVPDRSGTPGEVVLGFDRPEPYLSRETAPFLGSTVGRFANRIAQARYTLNGQEVHLTPSDGPHALHGGPRGFDLHLWYGHAEVVGEGAQVTFTRTSPHGEEGHPGTLHVQVTYHLTADPHPTLSIEYRATTDAPTHVNLTNHTYWNLSPDPHEGIGAHVLTLHADTFTPTHAGGIPTGTVQDVTGTPLDFRTPRSLGDALTDQPGGFDHNLLLRGQDGTLRPAATLHHPASGRTLDIHTTEPAIQLYTANFLNGQHTGHAGRIHGPRAGVCLETQHTPDSPNQPQFPTTRLDPGQTFTSRTVHTFRVT
ncbi:aldose 1-epimerase [Deinococcus grandis]|uniref:Aldose 1-epimerase n=1 Tax=Deinococcus grandis TaxID=57498 RepID=A0A100HLJ9_9DEIO|nr:aldose epimerase family protein [Deinococcus grandis]BBN93531.1 aldose 1-epimerase [Deinococcus grandis]GAQ22960.1 aldose 1-epimerase [Deinococcus grandis]